MNRSWWIIGWLTVAVAALLPLFGYMLRRPVEGACVVDGTVIDSLLRVRVTTDQRRDYSFCSLRCAEWWLSAAADGVRPVAIRVTDELSGDELPASAAHYVRSQVVANPLTNERRHVFRDLSAAEVHAESSRGRVFDRDERPFREFQTSPEHSPD